jgi:hypothetical protein
MMMADVSPPCFFGIIIHTSRRAAGSIDLFYSSSTAAQ